MDLNLEETLNFLEINTDNFDVICTNKNTKLVSTINSYLKLKRVFKKSKGVKLTKYISKNEIDNLGIIFPLSELNIKFKSPIPEFSIIEIHRLGETIMKSYLVGDLRHLNRTTLFGSIVRKNMPDENYMDTMYKPQSIFIPNNLLINKPLL